MNAKPHAHSVYVRDFGWFWIIEYGDQRSNPSKPTLFRNWRESRKLRREIAKLVRKHDRESRRAPKAAEKVRAAIPTFIRIDQWGSDQLR